jgi:hypothetical protein
MAEVAGHRLIHCSTPSSPEETNMAKKTLKALLEAGEFIAAPGVFDLVPVEGV